MLGNSLSVDCVALLVACRVKHKHPAGEDWDQDGQDRAGAGRKAGLSAQTLVVVLYHFLLLLLFVLVFLPLLFLILIILPKVPLVLPLPCTLGCIGARVYCT